MDRTYNRAQNMVSTVSGVSYYYHHHFRSLISAGIVSVITNRKPVQGHLTKKGLCWYLSSGAHMRLPLSDIPLLSCVWALLSDGLSSWVPRGPPAAPTLYLTSLAPPCKETPTFLLSPLLGTSFSLTWLVSSDGPPGPQELKIQDR